MIIGIDLGTSNCAVAFADPARGSDAAVEDFPIPQVQRLGEVVARPLLPSFIYLPATNELPAEAARLPWDSGVGPGDGIAGKKEFEIADDNPLARPSPDHETMPAGIVGEFARWQGARVPGRMVSSAKSWLCHPAVDRAAPILPWGAPGDVAKISPVTASAEYLRHLTAAWDAAHPDALLREQEVVVTVPASFDEVARALTVQAARKAGLDKFTLIEEPEAAFYDFMARHRHNLAAALDHVRLVLIIDVGGGTTDFTLVRVTISEKGPELERIAVGDHLMLGGDNMDAAVARRVEERLGETRSAERGTRNPRLSAAQWTQLVQGAREAKERLLGSDPADAVHVSVAGEGSRLMGSARSVQVARAEIEQLVVEGFFPFCAPDEPVIRSSRAALQELGLPYAQDAAITRHLADFLRNHAEAGFAALGETSSAFVLPRPDAILLNGGVFNSDRLSKRIVEVISSWWRDRGAVPLLDHASLDLAVVRGAAYYGLVRRGLGLRIIGGAAHALYVGLASAGGATPTQAICVIPRGHEQGEMIDLRERPFRLAIGKPVQFPLYSTTADRRDHAGAIVTVTDELKPLPPIHTLLKGRGAGTVPIHLRATLTEIGTLELFCVSTSTNEQWRLEFELRGAAGEAPVVTTESMPQRYSEARQAVESIFSPKAKPPKLGSANVIAGKSASDSQHPAIPPPDHDLPKNVKQLWASLERALGPRAQWSLPVLRELWTALLAGAARRRRSLDHERVYFQLIGYCLRPGFGYPLDEWRCGETFRLFTDAVEFHQEKPNWTEFWVLWRRIAPGLNEAQQLEIFNFVQPHLAWRLESGKGAAGKTASESTAFRIQHSGKLVRPKGIQPDGLDEMIKACASLEQLPVAEKNRLGEWILPRLSASGGAWAWAIGRLGARVPIRGSIHKVVDPGIASVWIEELLRVDWSKIDGAAFASAQLARLSGDRSRDIEDSLRQRVITALETAKAPRSWVRSVSEAAALEEADEARVLGDTLPAGLQLIDSVNGA